MSACSPRLEKLLRRISLRCWSEVPPNFGLTEELLESSESENSVGHAAPLTRSARRKMTTSEKKGAASRDFKDSDDTMECKRFIGFGSVSKEQRRFAACLDDSPLERRPRRKAAQDKSVTTESDSSRYSYSEVSPSGSDVSSGSDVPPSGSDADSSFVLDDSLDRPTTQKKTNGKENDLSRANMFETPSKKQAASRERMETPSQFKARRQKLSETCYEEYNATAFNNQLPKGLNISWSNRMNKTAGMTIFHSKEEPLYHGYGVRIELASKVLDSEDKLRRTLCHEMCHVAAWVVDMTRNPPHGPAFKKWARQAERSIPGMSVGTCHSYEIAYKYKYACVNSECGMMLGRHSKSVNLELSRCGRCGAKVQLLPRLLKDGTPAKTKSTPYADFVKARFAGVKASAGSHAKHGDIMGILAAEWKALKADNEANTQPKLYQM